MDETTITLRELIQRTGASVRLENASADSVFEITVAEFLARRPSALEQLTKTRNVGRKTIQELERAIDAYMAGQPAGDHVIRPSSPAAKPLEDPRLEGLPRELVGVPLRTLVERVGASVRLTNAATKEDFFQTTDVRSYLVQHRGKLPKLPNLGRTSAAELATLVEEYLECADSVLEAITSGANEPAVAFVSGETTEGVLTAIFTTMATRRFAPSSEIGLLPAREGALAAISALPKNGAFVIKRRYGLEGFRTMTLSEVADEAAVTRERVRQVEAKALKRLRLGAGAVFARLLEESTDAIWDILSGGRAVATLSSIGSGRGNLDPVCRVAIDILYHDEARWVASHGVTTENGWRRGASEISAGQQEHLGDLLAGLAFPRPIGDTAAEIGLSSSGIAALLENEPSLRSVSGFVYRGFVGARARRAVTLYQVATQEDWPRPFDIQTVAQSHRTLCADDAVASRMILKELQEHPHLFVRIFDSLWLTLPLHGEQWLDTMPASLPFERRAVMDDGGFDEGSIGRMLVQHLLQNGPQRLGDLQEVARSKGHASGVSVGPILLANSCFQRVLPGTYGLYAHCTEDQVNATMSVSQCRHFAYARYGGAPRDYFPLWSARYEHFLCRWARFQAPTDIFRSLMFVASPEDWSLPSEELAEWLEVKERHAAWSIGFARRDGMAAGLPAADAFFSALVHLALTGSISWYGVNRCAQQKLDSQEAVEILALMVGAGLAAAPSDWQGAHVRCASARSVLESLAKERWRIGSLDWRSGGLADVIALAAARVHDNDLGWVDSAELVALMRDAETGHDTVEEPQSKTESDSDGLNELLDSDAWSKLFDG